MTIRRTNSPKTLESPLVRRESGSDCDSCPNSPTSSTHSEDEMNDTNMSREWTTQWYSQEGTTSPSNWTLGSPKFKFCKKRKEYFTDRFETIWYKAPYKYNALLNFTHGPAFERSPFVQATLSIIFEDGTPIDINTDDGLPSISRTESVFRAKPTGGSSNREVKLGPFQFNVCSYKYDGKRFRLQLNFYLVQSENGSEIKEIDLQEGSDSNANFVHMCTMVSPPFLIKAKKPIAKPGIKSKKRTRETFEREEKEASLSPVNNQPTGMEINHIPLQTNYVNTISQFDIAAIAKLPFDAQKRIVESQLALLNTILPMEPAWKKMKQETPSPYYQAVPGYTMPNMCSFAQPIYYNAPFVQYQDASNLYEEPFRSMEQLTEEEPYVNLFDEVEGNTHQQSLFFDLDSYAGPQLASADFGNSDLFL